MIELVYMSGMVPTAILLALALLTETSSLQPCFYASKLEPVGVSYLSTCGLQNIFPTQVSALPGMCTHLK